jgi:hypothetical protein
MIEAGKEILGESSGKVWVNKETWWFNEVVQDKANLSLPRKDGRKAISKWTKKLTK